jgi:hypothetical protein
MTFAHRHRRHLRVRRRLTLETLETRTTPALAGLGAAGEFSVLDINHGSLTIRHSSLAGDAGVGPQSSAEIRTTSLDGAVDVDPSGFLKPRNGSAKDWFSNGVVTESLSQARDDANAASAAYAALAPTQSFGNLKASTTIHGNGGINVIDVKSVDLSHKTLTLDGGPADAFIFNVARDFTFDQSTTVLTGGVTADHVVFNFAHAASSIDIENSPNVAGTFLAPRSSLTLAGSSSFDGELIAKEVFLANDAGFTADGFTVPTGGPGSASLSGFVYADNNYSHTRDSGEQGIGDITIVLSGTDVNNQTVNLTTTTAADGSYTFTGLADGTYQVTEQLPSFYFGGTNAVGTVNGTSDGALVGGDTIGSIVLHGGDKGVEYDFAVVPPPV